MTTLFRQLEAFHSDASHPSGTVTMHSQATHSQRQIPQEIFDHIIDYFYDQPEELRTCALVSPPWLASARAHLFYRIALGPPKVLTRSSFLSNRQMASSRIRGTPPCQKLYKMIEPQINLESKLGSFVQYIREVHIHEGVNRGEWIVEESTLPSLLRALNNVRRLDISRAASTHIYWEDLPPDLKSALLDHVLKLESFSSLRLSNFFFQSFKDMATILLACRDLRRLVVDHILFNDESTISFDREVDGDVLGDARRISSLETLIVGPRIPTTFITSFLLHPLAPVTLQNVRELSMSISGDFATFAKLMHASTSVERLEVSLMNDVNLQEYWSLSPTDQLRLSQLPRLRDLEVSIDILQKMEDPLPWLSALLSTGADSRQNEVKTVSVLYSLYLPAPYMDRYTYTGMFNKWSEIDAILCGVDTAQREREAWYGYKNLESVELEFALENPIGSGVAPRFLNELVLESPGLKSKGILHIHAFDTSR